MTVATERLGDGVEACVVIPIATAEPHLAPCFFIGKAEGVAEGKAEGGTAGWEDGWGEGGGRERRRVLGEGWGSLQ